MKTIPFTSSHARKHFDYFRAMDQPHFGITANVDITEFLELVRASAELRFTPAIVYLIARTANEIPQFKRRIREEKVVEHDFVRPSFAVPTKGEDAFSFCTVTYNPDPWIFHQAAVDQMEKMKNNPSFEDEEGMDDYLFLSTFPWASFTSVQHAMPSALGDSVPRIVWGKYFKVGDKVMMPLAVQAHHAVVDGSHLGKYYQLIQRYLRDAEAVFLKKVKHF